MSDMTLQFLHGLAKAFDEGRLLELAQNYAFPMPAYTEDDLLVFGSPETLTEGLVIYRDIAVANGIVRTAPRIVAEGLRINNYANLWVEWDHFDASDTCKRTSQVRYVLRFNPQCSMPLIELVEFVVPAFPEISEHLPLVRTG
mmetsp:Transcript_24127/g.44844  ORF Transcript_24127/g.44844 Transcript_24127/m.44844 type:complete len:143 (+) Transcript_24127:9546-9974(+)